MVNIFQGANTQAQAVANTEGATQYSNIINDVNKAGTKEKINKDNMMEKLLQKGDNKDVSLALLGDLMSKVADAGITFDKTMPRDKVAEQKKELKKSNLDEGEYGDTVQVSTDKESALPIGGVSQGKAKFGKANKDLESKWEAVKEKLEKEGKPKEAIARMETQFKTNEMKKNMLQLLKESALLYYLDSDTQTSEMIRMRGFSDLMKKVDGEVAKEAVSQSHNEIKQFVLHELENQMILHTFLGDTEFKDALKLINIGNKVGLDPLPWLKEVWPNKKEDLGLNILDIPHEVTGYVNLKDTDHDRDSRREREKHEYKDEDEKNIMLNRLRAQYLQLALRPGMVNTVKTWFKIRTLKSGAQRLGVFTKDMDEKVQEEAKTLAKIRTMEVLEEALLENASVFDPSKEQTLQNKIKNCIKNLDRLGFKLDDKDFMELRDKANERIHELIQKEIEQTKQTQGPAAEQRLQQLQKLSVRLVKESNLREEA
jgi:hypothetical protein